ncbi:MAG: GlsB/YeaQ/YmgE family stress response membrane protein [Bosea sp. (in: a-proteobacteria)]
MRTVLMAFGLAGLTNTELVIVLALAFTAAVFAGWLADTIMEDMGFGITINAITLAIGGLFGLWLWHRTGYALGSGKVVMSIIACTASAIAALLMTSIIRRYF